VNLSKKNLEDVNVGDTVEGVRQNVMHELYQSFGFIN